MSRAFTKERDDLPDPEVVPTRIEPHVITAAGLARLERELKEATDEKRRTQLRRIIDAATVGEPPQDAKVAGFGASVTVTGEGIGERTFTIVGEQEIDVARGRIGAHSPLARALIGQRAGDAVVWHRPAGDLPLTIRSVTYDD